MQVPMHWRLAAVHWEHQRVSQKRDWMQPIAQCTLTGLSIYLCLYLYICIYIATYLYIYIPMSVFIMTRDDSKAHTYESILGNKEANLLNQILLCAGRSFLPQTPPALLSLTYREAQVINKFSCYGSCFLLPLEWSMLFDMVPTALLPPATLALGALCQGHLPAAGQTVWVLAAILLILRMLTLPCQVRHLPSQEDLSSTEPVSLSLCLDSCVSHFWSPSSSLPLAEMPPSLPRNSRRCIAAGQIQTQSCFLEVLSTACSWKQHFTMRCPVLSQARPCMSSFSSTSHRHYKVLFALPHSVAKSWFQLWATCHHLSCLTEKLS